MVAKEITKLTDKSEESVKEISLLLEQLKNKVNHDATIVQETVETASSQMTAIGENSLSLQHLADVAEEIEK